MGTLDLVDDTPGEPLGTLYYSCQLYSSPHMPCGNDNTWSPNAHIGTLTAALSYIVNGLKLGTYLNAPLNGRLNKLIMIYSHEKTLCINENDL